MRRETGVEGKGITGKIKEEREDLKLDVRNKMDKDWLVNGWYEIRKKESAHELS